MLSITLQIIAFVCDTHSFAVLAATLYLCLIMFKSDAKLTWISVEVNMIAFLNVLVITVLIQCTPQIQ